jgi:hypothetical protein
VPVFGEGHPHAAPRATPPRSGLERVVEQGLLTLGRIVVAVVLGAVVWGFLVASFFLCCAVGPNAVGWADPRSGPGGPWITVLIIWPLTGFFCMMLQSVPGELLGAGVSGAKHLLSALRHRFR